MAKQSLNGKAFEYSCLSALKNQLEQDYNQTIIIDSTEAAYITAKKDFDSLAIEEQQIMIVAAEKGIHRVINYEPKLIAQTVPIKLYIQTDKNGITGDVRDVICEKPKENWGFGISCKNNHHAVKHSRLSPSIDFGEKWMKQKNSQQYWTETKSIWDYLISQTNLNPIPTWNSLGERKITNIYEPLLNAFIKEMRLLATNPTNVSNLLKYLLGEYDFYKVIANNSMRYTEVMPFNMYGTLNQKYSGQATKTKVPITPLPTKMYEIIFKDNGSNNTVEASFDGWGVSFRIHNASTNIEKSLKFDINLTSVPSSLQSTTEPWD